MAKTNKTKEKEVEEEVVKEEEVIEEEEDELKETIEEVINPTPPVASASNPYE